MLHNFIHFHLHGSDSFSGSLFFSFSQLAILMADSRLSLYFLRWPVGVSYMNVLYHLSFGVRVGHYVKTVKLGRSQSKRVYVAGSS